MTLSPTDRQVLVGMTKILRTDDPEFVERMNWHAAKRALAASPPPERPSAGASPSRTSTPLAQRFNRTVSALALIAALALVALIVIGVLGTWLWTIGGASFLLLGEIGWAAWYFVVHRRRLADD